MFGFYGAGKNGPTGDITPSEFPAPLRMMVGRHSGRVGFVCSFFHRVAVVFTAILTALASFC
jgi:hypothetical protein